MPTEAALIAQVASLAAMDAFKSASLPNDDMADYQLANLAMLKAIEEKTSASLVTYAAAALGKRNAATSLSVVDAQQRLITKTFARPATTPTYVSGQVIGDVAAANASSLTITNLFGQAVVGTAVKIKKIGLLRTAAAPLAAANYRIITGSATFSTALDATAFAVTPAAAVAIQSIQTINMTALTTAVHYGEILLEEPITSSTALADAFAAIMNLGSVLAVASESFTLSYTIQD